jgi:hypothetical protein
LGSPINVNTGANPYPKSPETRNNPSLFVRESGPFFPQGYRGTDTSMKQSLNGPRAMNISREVMRLGSFGLSESRITNKLEDQTPSTIY